MSAYLYQLANGIKVAKKKIRPQRSLRTWAVPGALRLERANSALHLRSVCLLKAAFCGLRCHPLTCMSLNLRFQADSNPFAASSFPKTATGICL
jgi:hypothetical protein